MKVLEELPRLDGRAVESLCNELDLGHIVATCLHVDDSLVYSEANKGVLEVLARNFLMVLEANDGCKVWVNLV